MLSRALNKHPNKWHNCCSAKQTDDRNKTNWIEYCAKSESIYYIIYLPYTYTICNIEGSTPIYRLNDRQSATCRSLAESDAPCLYQMTTNHNNNNKMMKKQKKKTRKNTRFIKNIQLLFIIKKPNNNRLCFYFIRFDFSFWFSFSSYNGFRNIQSTLFGQKGLSHQDIVYNMVSPHGLI